MSYVCFIDKNRKRREVCYYVQCGTGVGRQGNRKRNPKRNREGKIDSIDRLRDIRDALLVEQGINPTRQGEQAIKVVVERIDEIQATLDKSATKNRNRK